MRWDRAIAAVETVQVGGSGAIEVGGVQYDSRRVVPGDVFVAMRGGSSDGNRFIATALAQGASAIITDSPERFAELSQKDVPVALVQHGRRALAEISAEVFGHPERRLQISAVTGTNGKTTTAFLLEQLLRSAGRKSVLLGTIETHVGDEVRPSAHTTPEGRDVLELFAEGVRVGCTEVVMEASSHALEQERLWALPVDVALFTNLTQDHLDFHGTMEAYAQAKAKLFAGTGAASPRAAVLNADDPYASLMRQTWQAAEAAYGERLLMLYGIDRGEWRAIDVQLAAGGSRFRWVTPYGEKKIQMRLTGRVNVYNFLAAACAAYGRGLSLDQIAEAAKTLRAAPGRFEVVHGSERNGFTVVVDYAHTDDALRNLIALARDLVQPAGGRVITVFGCGGDRDKTKRPKMGHVAAEGSDLVVVTSDNPRSEDPRQIIEDVLVGVREAKRDALVEVDRSKAIALAIRSARPGDIVLLAGKGHEKTQTFADRTVPFDDVAEAEKVLQEVSQ